MPDIPHGLSSALIYVPAKMEVLDLSIGTGDNLEETDVEAGYVDYVNIDVYSYVGSGISDAGFEAGDSGMMLTKTVIMDIAEIVSDVLDYQYGDGTLEVIYMGVPSV